MENIRYSHCFEKLIKQHEQIKAASHYMFQLLESQGDVNGFHQLTALNEQLRVLSQLSYDHFKQEEETLIPIIKEMYSHRDELSVFLQHEHSNIHEQYEKLVQLISNHPNDAAIDLEDIPAILNQHLEHLFIEEQGLFPLIQKYLNEMKNKALH